MYEQTIKKGSLVNALGLAGKALLPVLFIIIARLFGSAEMGIFYQSFVLLDLGFSFALSGIKDGIILFASRAIQLGTRRGEYRAILNGLAVSIVAAALALLVYHLAVRGFILDKYPDGRFRAIADIMVWALPLYAMPAITAAAARARLQMQWDAILLGFLRPALLCVGALVVAAAGAGLEGLAWAYLSGNAVLCVVSLGLLFHWYRPVRFLGLLRRFVWDRAFLKFIIPQNLNMTFNNAITNMDIMMLGFFSFDPVLIGYYGIGAQIALNVRQIKISFAGAFGPVIARLHAENNAQRISELFSTISSWSLAIALPVILVIVAFNEELLKVFLGSFSGDATFMYFLLIPPLLSCLIGMAGDIIVMSGHSGWNLANSAAIAALNMGFNFFLIPAFGLNGAALSAALAAICVYFAQLFEAGHLLRIRFNAAVAMRPLLYLVAAFSGPAFLFPFCHGLQDGGVVVKAMALASVIFPYVLFWRFDKKRGSAGISGV